MQEEYQKYGIKGLNSEEDANVIIEELDGAGYYQCMADHKNSLLIVPIAYAGYIDDIEEILLKIEYEFEE